MAHIWIWSENKTKKKKKIIILVQNKRATTTHSFEPLNDDFKILSWFP